MREFKKKDKKLFGAVVSYYPGCGLAGGSIPQSSYVPIIIHIAEKDELVTPYLNCVEPINNSNLTLNSLKFFMRSLKRIRVNH